jgi:hypothetical protein
MTDDQIIEVTEIALKEVAVEQKALLKTGRVERTFSTRLRDKLLPLFSTEVITVDAPYNRHLQATKRLGDRVIELDVAIHQPFNDGHNILAIEIETNNYPEENDLWKLEGLTQKLEGYGYQLGLFVAFGVKDKAGEIIKMTWFKNGGEI